MGFRFRRSIRILPGLRLNIGKRGMSTSIGGRGAHITVGHGQVRETAGLPGSGISFTHVGKAHGDAPGAAQLAPVIEPLPKGRAWAAGLGILLLLAIAARVAWLLVRS
jgi:hypothetical protein